jgi:hypothetical protein
MILNNEMLINAKSEQDENPYMTIGSQRQLPALATQSLPSKLPPKLCCACTSFTQPENETDAAAIPSIKIADFIISKIVLK